LSGVTLSTDDFGNKKTIDVVMSLFFFKVYGERGTSMHEGGHGCRCGCTIAIHTVGGHFGIFFHGIAITPGRGGTLQ
jgi:hypothetical protein